MTLTRENDPFYLTTFSPLPAESENEKKESVLSRVLRKFTGTGDAHSAIRQSSLHTEEEEHLSRHVVPSVEVLPLTATAGDATPEPSRGGFYAPSAGTVQYSHTFQDALDVTSSAAMEDEAQQMESRHRNLGNVLQRIKAIAAKGTPTNVHPYRDRDFQQYWLPDALAHECYECGTKFSTFRRRRHCRVCGQIFCNKCASQEIPGYILGFSNSIRMCSFCAQVVLSYRQCSLVDSAQHGEQRYILTSSTDSPTPALFGGQTERVSTPALSRKPSDDASGLSFEQLREIWLEMSHANDGLELKQHRHRFRVLTDCVSGTEIVEWLVARGKGGIKTRRNAEENRRQAVAIGQGLLNFKFLEFLTSAEMVFSDEYVLYKLKTVTDELEEVNLFAHNLDLEREEPTWLQEIPHERQREDSGTPTSRNAHSTDDNLDLFIPHTTGQRKLVRSSSLQSLNTQLAASSEPTASSTSVSPIGLLDSKGREVSEEVAFQNIPEVLNLWRQVDYTGPAQEPTESQQELETLFQDNLRRLILHLQLWEGLCDEHWLPLVLSLATTVTDHVQPKVRHGQDDMDIGQYVHIKKVPGGVPGGVPTDSRVVFGVVCSKNVAHRKMRQNLVNPVILLYGSALEYQRVENKFSSLEPIMQQEAEFLRNYVKKISELQPDILFVERNVSRLAHDYLFEEGITLVANVKTSTMNRIARCTACDKFSVIDERFLRPRLGTCAKFEVKTVQMPDGTEKALMVLEGCPKHLGCTVVLRGDTRATLVKVKHILTFVVHAMYNWKLEKALLLTQHARIPPHSTPVEITDREINPEVSSAEKFDRLVTTFQPSVSLFTKLAKPEIKTEKPFWSKKLLHDEPLHTTQPVGTNVPVKEDGSLGAIHALLQLHMTKTVEDASVQRSLASFRANGGRLKLPVTQVLPTSTTPSVSHSSTMSTSASQTVVKNEPVDCFDVYQHQRLTILCSIHAVESEEAPSSFCVSPWILVIEFYGKNDLTLGDYLESFCFRPEAQCPNGHCHKSSKEHVRRFATGDMALSVVIRDLPKSTGPPLPHLVTWTWCKICKEVSPVTLLKDEGWSLSFAKYLDLRFHAPGYRRSTPSSSCQHSLNHDHVHFFAMGNTVAAFKMAGIQVRQVVSPPMIMNYHLQHHMPLRMSLIDKVKGLAIKGHNVFSAINEHLASLQALDSDKIHEQLPSLLVLSRSHRQMFRDKLECLQIKLASPLLKLEVTGGEDTDCAQQSGFAWDIEDAIVSLKVQVTETALKWNTNLADMEALRRKEERKRTLKSFQSTPDLTAHDTYHPPSVAITIDPLDTDFLNQPANFSLGVGGQEDEPATDQSSTGLRRSATEAVFNVILATPTSLDPTEASSSRSSVVSRPSRSAPPVGSYSQAVPLPFPPNEHYLPIDSGALPVVVYDDDLSSMIAYTLTSAEYKAQVHLQRQAKHAPSPSTSQVLPADSASEVSLHTKPSSGSSEGGHHHQPFVDVQFADYCARFYCRLYFAEEFYKLRKLVFPSGEDRFIRSLSRSVVWKALGGKSGSSFTKSADGRFVLKQMSRLELQSFVDFAPHYFTYITQAIEENRTTVLAKIVGVYRVGFRNSQTGAVAKQNLLVMENLFYGRKVQQVFDLKGSLRNRLVNLNDEALTADGAELVLLDENFLRNICQHPLYVQPQAKLALSKALSVDTEFLASLYVMDYSLLVGIDEGRKELVLGIIDYIRTFTWDKRLEMVVKKGFAMGGHKVLPTILSPELYRSRFCDAMQRYFLPVPDQWYALARFPH